MSYVDNGSIIIQSDDIMKNLPKLKRAYKTMVKLTQVMGLEIKHDKSEVFHFSHNLHDPDPPIDLGFAPYTGASPLKPKDIWRYLGFFFDKCLSFQTHVKCRCTQALSMARALPILRNSIHGLKPIHKCLLYRSCMVPLTIYGARLWNFKGMPKKGMLNSLRKMQRQACLWILGTFRTSPTRVVELLAGLPPFTFI